MDDHQSKPERVDLVWIHAHVEEMRVTDEYTAFTRAEWDAMTTQQRDDAIDQAGADAVAGAGGYGASVVDESEVPEEWKQR